MLYAAWIFARTKIGRWVTGVGAVLVFVGLVALKAYLAGRAAINEKIRRDTLEAKERRNAIDRDIGNTDIAAVRDRLRDEAD